MNYVKVWKRLKEKAAEGARVPKNPLLIAVEEIEEELRPKPMKVIMKIDERASIEFTPCKASSGDLLGILADMEGIRSILLLNRAQAKQIAYFLEQWGYGKPFPVLDDLDLVTFCPDLKIEYEE